MEIHGTSKLSGLQIAVEEKLLNPVCSWVLHTRHESNLFHWQEVMADVDWFLWNRPERWLNFVYTHQQKKKEHFWSFIWRNILVIVFQFSNFVAGILLKPIFKFHGKSYRDITNFFLVERFHELLRKLVTSRSSRWLVLCPQKMLIAFQCKTSRRGTSFCTGKYDSILMHKKFRALFISDCWKWNLRENFKIYS